MRPPDFTVITQGKAYLERWYVIPRNRFFNIYLHHFLASDEDRALHDHPWCSLSIVLRGRYTEHLPDGRTRSLRITARRASAAHRVELTNGPVWTLFLTGPRVREWGFHCPQGWRHWREFTAESPGRSDTGRGCE